MNTTKGATNPPIPPADVGEWDERAYGYWESGDFRIDHLPVGELQRDGQLDAERFEAALSIGQNGDIVELGNEHPTSQSAVGACRDVAGALQRARRHDTTK